MDGTRYNPPNPQHRGHVLFADLWNEKHKRAPVGILGFACDEGVKRNHGRPGAAQGPAAFREAFYSSSSMIDSLYDFGDITCIDGDLEASQQVLGEAIDRLHSQTITPLVIGGGHELAWGHFQGIAPHYPECAIINIDAHFDLRPLLNNNKGSSGTPFQQIAHLQRDRFFYYVIGIQESGNASALFQEADRLGVEYLFAKDIEHAPEFFDRIVEKHAEIYLSVCLDAFAASSAPGVSAPQPLGLSPDKALPLIKSIISSGKVVSCDIAELSPPYDQDGCTARLAAAIADLLISQTASTLP
ncbi:MAG: formimidoylglutamase [Waddliaceae bacterium]